MQLALHRDDGEAPLLLAGMQVPRLGDMRESLGGHDEQPASEGRHDELSEGIGQEGSPRRCTGVNRTTEPPPCKVQDGGVSVSEGAELDVPVPGGLLGGDAVGAQGEQPEGRVSGVLALMALTLQLLIEVVEIDLACHESQPCAARNEGTRGNPRPAVPDGGEDQRVNSGNIGLKNNPMSPWAIHRRTVSPKVQHAPR